MLTEDDVKRVIEFCLNNQVASANALLKKELPVFNSALASS